MENRFALGLAKPLWNRNALQSDLEWLVTWKIKQAKSSEPMWCDGTKDLNLERTSKKTLDISALVTIGPESDVMTLNLANLKGTITLSQNCKKLKAYYLKIQDGETSYVLSKKT